VKSSQNKLLEKARNNPAGLRFKELQRLCEVVGMKLARVKGSHFIYIHENPTFAISLQEMRDGKAKSFQVKQLLDKIDEHGLDK
jgi:hypothetical protein